jgi:hypothetical protein
VKHDHKSEESDKCDLWKALWISEGRFTTDDDFTIQTLEHVQITCKSLSVSIHTLTHHLLGSSCHGKAGTSRETIVEKRIWNKRPDGLAIKIPTPEKTGFP